MSSIAIGFGILLAVLSGILYPLAEVKSPTLFIPAFFGVALIGLGLLARIEKARMHAMHLAALVGLVGFLVPAFRAGKAIIGGAEINLPIGGQLAMAAICLAFVGMCVKSFIDARRARKSREAQSM